MTENDSEIFTRINSPLVVNGGLYTDLATSGVATINDASKDNRVVTLKDLPWRLDSTNNCLYAKKKMEATMKAAASEDRLINVEPKEQSYISYSLNERGCFDIANITYDEMATDVDQWIVCSRSSGVWLLAFTNNKPIISHVPDSECCCCVGFDRISSTNNYLFGADMLCFDDYDITVSGDVTTIVSTKVVRNEVVSDVTHIHELEQTITVTRSESGGVVSYAIAKTIGLTDNTYTVEVQTNTESTSEENSESSSTIVSTEGNVTTIVTTHIVVSSGTKTTTVTTKTITRSTTYTEPAVSYTTKEVKLLNSSGYLSRYGDESTSHFSIVYKNNNTEVCVVNCWFPLTFNVAAADSPTSAALTATTANSNIGQIRFDSNMYVCQWYDVINELATWGVLYYTHGIGVSSGTTFESCWDNGSTYTGCPSISNIVVALSYSGTASAPLIYIFNNIYNDYVTCLNLVNLITDSSTPVFNHAVNMFSGAWLRLNYNGKLLNRGNTDIMTLNTDVGTMALSGGNTAGSLLHITYSPDVTYEGNKRFITNIISVKVGDNYYDYAIDDRHKLMFGMYNLPNGAHPWHNPESGSTMTTNDCTFIDGSTTITNAASIGYIVPNANGLIIAVSGGNNLGVSAVWCNNPATDNTFYKVYDIGKRRCVGVHTYKGCLILSLNNSTATECVQLIGLMRAATVAEAKQLTVKTLSLPYDGNVTHATYLNSATIDTYSASAHMHNVDKYLFNVDYNENILIPDLEEHVVVFKGPIYNEVTYKDLTRRISLLSVQPS